MAPNSLRNSHTQKETPEPKERERETKQETLETENSMEESSYSYSSSSEPSSPITNPNPTPNFSNKKKKKPETQRLRQEEKAVESPLLLEEPSWPRRNSGVMLEGYVETADGGGDHGSDGGDSVVGRTKSLTDEDLEELKGCLDLGFGFSYEEIPELCNTLPALELCYSMSQRFMDEQQQQQRTAADEAAAGESCSANGGSSVPIANWKISSPGDHPEEVKARLKYWAQAVACTVRLCN